MATTEVRARAASSLRELGTMQTYQVPIVLGGAIAVLAGVVTYVLGLVREAAWVPSAAAIFLAVFGVLALIGYRVSKAHARNGMIVAGVAGLALLLVAGGSAGLLTGLVVLVGAVWGLAKSL